MAKANHSQLFDMGASNLNEIIHRKSVDLDRDNLYISVPAKVTGTDDYEKMQCVSVKPVIDSVYVKNNGTTIEAKTLDKVFVRLPSFGGVTFKFPVNEGDDCVLHFSHKDLGDWFGSNGEEQIQQSIYRRGEMNDCWVEMGFGTLSKNHKPSKDNFMIDSPECVVTIQPDGSFIIDNGNKVEVTKEKFHVEHPSVFDKDTQMGADLKITTITVPSGKKGLTVTFPNGEGQSAVFENGILTQVITTPA